MGFELPSSSQDSRPMGRVARNTRQEFAFQPGERPHDIEGEKAVLAGIFLSNEVFPDVQNNLKTDDFFLPAHREIFHSMAQLSIKNIPVDLTTVSNYLRDQGKLDIIGSAAYLAEIINTPSTSAHAVQYSQGVADLAWRRRLLDVADLSRAAALKAGDTRDIANEIEKTVFEATQQKKSNRISRVGDLLVGAISELERRADQKGLVIEGVSTGLKDLDVLLGGFRPGQLVVLAAGPGAGKTSLAANIMYAGSVKQKKNILFFSLEMTQEEITERLLAFAANLDATKLRSGNLSGKDFQNLYDAAEEVGPASMYFDDRSVLTPYDVMATARKMNAQLHIQNPGQKLDLIIVDYIQIMKSGSNSENRNLEVAAITGGLKAIAKELRVPVLALSQLNRDRSKRGGADGAARPQLSDLKDSGAIEADADVVLFIHRDQGPQNDSRAPAEAEIIIAKQRSGPTGIVKVTWLGNLTKYVDFADPGHYSGSEMHSQDSGPPDQNYNYGAPPAEAGGDFGYEV